MSTLTLNSLTAKVGAEVTGIDVDRALNDESLPALILEALEEKGVLVFPGLGLDPQTQVTFGQRLGSVHFAGGDMAPEPGIMRVSLDPARAPAAEALRGTFHWHIDGCTLADGDFPGAATILTAVALADRGGQTEFASTYHAFDDLTADEKHEMASLMVHHTVAATQRLVIPNPSPEMEAVWAAEVGRDHPLIWRHRSGRHSVVLGATAESVIGMDPAAGRELLDDLLLRATSGDRVYRHEWSVGDTVIWDNRGALHRVEPYDNDSPREMIRTSLAGDEPIA
jgi:alpha-ketoglutarate-dependent taurine dioxygenase